MLILKVFLKGLGLLIITLLLLVSMLYWHTRFYNFKVPEPFKGSKIYNPYSNIETDSLYKANFHAHSQAWGGLTNGHNSPAELYKAYKDKGYRIASISNYHQIRPESDIPVYEHGFNIRKSHKLALFTPEVSLIDFPFYQTTSHKQTIVDLLKEKKALVGIAHPEFWESHLVEEFEVLDNYEFIEVLNHYRISEKHWERALSTGHPAWILADDDTHDIDNEPTFIMWNLIFAADSHLDTLKTSLLKGRHYGVHGEDATTTNKLVKTEVENLTIRLFFQENYTQISLIGQAGIIRKEATNQNYIAYQFQADDHYIRAVVHNRDESVFYLNPFIRYDGRKLAYPVRNNKIDFAKTYLFRLLLILADCLLILGALKILKIRLRKKNSKFKINLQGSPKNL